MKEVKEALNSVLDTDQKKLVYHLSDGNKGIIEIGKATGIASTATISRYWKNWVRLSLGEYVSVQGGDRFKRSFDLEDFGIDVPQIKQTEKEEKQKVEPTAAKKSEVSSPSEGEHYA